MGLHFNPQSLHWVHPEKITNTTWLKYNIMLIQQCYVFLCILDKSLALGKMHGCHQFFKSNLEIQLLFSNSFCMKLHSYILASEWFPMWCFRLQGHANPSSHILHLYGISPVCETIWRFRNLAWVNFLPHMLHICDVPVCVVRCVWKVLHSANCFLHMSQ